MRGRWGRVFTIISPFPRAMDGGKPHAPRRHRERGCTEVTGKERRVRNGRRVNSPPIRTPSSSKKSEKKNDPGERQENGYQSSRQRGKPGKGGRHSLLTKNNLRLPRFEWGNTPFRGKYLRGKKNHCRKTTNSRRENWSMPTHQTRRGVSLFDERARVGRG